ncbi:MAG: hypothetical protein HY730_05200 [Candidatus Tectomicrobia bacterium]|uniref:Tetratricopeptide repeat protein n=1 Tax=Tectimicrobiota bacterium TaxID=2528274 RepID=A0A933GNG5_UNCTE|nr:hypothetical protein [Candidatus Tectomicrobia bacterium]
MGLKETMARNLSPFRALHLYIFCLFGTCLFYLSRWSIVALDNDLWYHLNTGRYIFQNKSLPYDSFFSFIKPARPWVDYYWLFQVVVYGMYSLWEYYGLIFLRAAIYLATISVILIYLLRRQPGKEHHLYLMFIFSLYLLFLLPRASLVRPHAFTYLFIVAFLYIIEFQSGMLFLLPVLAILWSNLHGVEYPVMLLILCSFIFEFILEHVKNRRHIQRNELPYIIPLILAMAAIYITPYGPRLLEMPFKSTAYASQFINELKFLKFNDLLTFQITWLGPTFPTIFNLILIFAGISILTAISKREIKAHHLLLFIGGLFLMMKASRFMYEFALLALPILRSQPLQLSLRTINKRMKWIVVLIIAAVLFSPFFWLKTFFQNQPKYPFSTKDLPQGIANFLNLIPVPAGGYLLNHPQIGGYLQWILHPKYKIYMDMEVPFLFTYEDFFLGMNAFHNEGALSKVLSKYHPSFVTVSIQNRGFKDLISKFPQYAPVFFDTAEVLYVNKEHYPAIAQEYGLKDLDPFELFHSPVDSILKKTNHEVLVKELLKVVGTDPGCLMTNQILATIFNMKEDYDRALDHAKTIIHNFPENPAGYLLKGTALKGLKLYDEALPAYRDALARSDEKAKLDIYKLMSSVYMRQKQYFKGYDALKKGIGIFSPDTTHIDLFNLSSAALLAGRTEEAITILKLAGKKIPPHDTAWQERVQEQLARLGVRTKE